MIQRNDSGLTPAVTFAVEGKKSTVNVELRNGAAGYYVSGHNNDPSPAATLNAFGLGTTLVYPFNPVAVSSGDQATIDALLVDSVNYVAPTAHGLDPLGIAPVSVDLINVGRAGQCRFDEFPASELQSSWAADGGAIEDNQITWVRYLATDDELNLRFGLRLPDQVGTFPTITDVSYLHGGTYQLYGSYVLDLTVTQDSWDVLVAAEAALASLAVSGADLDARDDALSALYQITPALEETPAGAEEAIIHVIDALEYTAMIEGVDPSAIMIDLGRLLTAWEVKSVQSAP